MFSKRSIKPFDVCCVPLSCLLKNALFDEPKVVAELEKLEQSSRIKAAEASKIQEERLKAEEKERMLTGEERMAQEKLRFMIEEEERKKWEEVLAAQREIAENGLAGGA